MENAHGRGHWRAVRQPPGQVDASVVAQQRVAALVWAARALQRGRRVGAFLFHLFIYKENTEDINKRLVVNVRPIKNTFKER